MKERKLHPILQRVIDFAQKYSGTFFDYYSKEEAESSSQKIICEKCLFVPVRCQCAYCEICKNNAIVYEECIECYEGKHPHLPKIENDFEHYMDNDFKEKLRIERDPRVYHLIRNTDSSTSPGAKR